MYKINPSDFYLLLGDFFCACPSWAEENQFYFLLAQIGNGRIGFTSCLPKMGMEESVLLLACPSWGWKNQFYFLLAQAGDGRISFISCLPMMGRGESVLLLVCPNWAEENFLFVVRSDSFFVLTVATFECNQGFKKNSPICISISGSVYCLCSLLFCLRTYLAISIATATCTVAPTIGLLPIPMNPIIST